MGKVFLDMAMSLDGFVTGSNNEDRGLYDWYFAPSGANATRPRASNVARAFSSAKVNPTTDVPFANLGRVS
jgi:hypothetical protein